MKVQYLFLISMLWYHLHRYIGKSIYVNFNNSNLNTVSPLFVFSDLKHVRRQRDGDGKLNNVELNKLRKKIGPQYPLYETNTV